MRSLASVAPQGLSVEKARYYLANARSVDEVKEIRDKARAIEAYQRSRGAALESQQDASEIVLRAERRLGELCSEVAPTARRGRPPENGNSVLPFSALDDIGVSKMQSSRWQKLAAIPEEDFDAHVRAVRDKGEKLTTAGTIRAVSDAEGYDSDEWYTPSEYVEAARSVMGGIDLDPATCAAAQVRIGAKRFYTKADGGLEKPWKGRVWLNPPYSQPQATDFADKLLAEFRSGAVLQAVMVQNSGTDTAWFHRMASEAWVCFIRGRINFENASGRVAGNRYAQVFFYLGNQTGKFGDVFGEFGLVGKLSGRL